MLHALVLERDPHVGALVRRTFETRGPYRVTTAPEARQALNIMADDRPDLALIDELLPGLGGWEFARHAVHLGTPVLMLTGSEMAAMRLRRAGCPFVPKPFHVEFLLQETRRLLREGEKFRQTMLQFVERLLENRDELAVAARRDTAGRSSVTGAAAARPAPSMWRSFRLRVVPRPERGKIIQAPPAITVRPDSNYYLCGGCDTLLMIADTEHLRGFVIRCRNCASCNATDA